MAKDTDASSTLPRWPQNTVLTNPNDKLMSWAILCGEELRCLWLYASDRATHGNPVLGHRGPLLEPGLGAGHVGEHLVAGPLPMESKEATWDALPKLALGTWNVTSLMGKEPELMREVEVFRLDIVGLTSTHSKGSGTSLLGRGWTLYHSGVADVREEWSRRIGAASTVMRTLHWSVVVNRELRQKAIYRSIFVPTLTYGHELWVMTERTKSWVQAAEMSFLRMVAGLSLRDRVRSSAIREKLGVARRWLGHLVRMPHGWLPGEVFRACPSGRRPPGRPRTRWRDYVSRLV
ncbi:hypothetical protein D4764_12G0004200 [Takifugu flavidus]|uniref:Endonuclease/exonuclease/phosphatase domain-containing protein n=1 Tax=Takifugu flavidus TaxID=433684 RepID=A0A5C6PFM6_9TELE|nr:hypothetical protein D4764_12G0004200 [Takifugu flavidus]